LVWSGLAFFAANPVTAVHLPLTSVADDVATVNWAIGSDPGPLLLASLNVLVPATPVAAQIRLNAVFLSISTEGIITDFARDLSDTERRTLAATQGPIAAASLGTPASAPA
jgi:hypothetical protein